MVKIFIDLDVPKSIFKLKKKSPQKSSLNESRSNSSTFPDFLVK